MKQLELIQPFLDEEGKIQQYPVKQQKKLAALQYLGGKFCPNTQYTEPEVNAIIAQWHTFDDICLLRRDLVDFHILMRKTNGETYWRTTQETAQGGESTQ